MLVVDDGSPDGARPDCRRLAAEHRRVPGSLHRTAKEGTRSGLSSGLPPCLQNGAAFVLEMDSDFSHVPPDLARLLGAVAGRCGPLALRSRYIPGGAVSDWGLLRRLVSEGGSGYARIVLGLGVRDLTGGFKCFRREVLQAIHFDSVRSQGYAFQVELTYRAVRAGFRVVEVPIAVPRPPAWAEQDVLAIAAEAMWLVPQLRLGRQPPSVPASASAASRSEDGPVDGGTEPSGEHALYFV